MTHTSRAERFEELPILEELRELLAARLRAESPAAPEVRPPASGRIGLARRARMGLVLAGSAGIAAATGVVLALIGLGGGAQPAFAGWSASPTLPASGQTAAAQAACLARLPDSSDAQRAQERGPVRAPVLKALFGAAGHWQVVLTDTRGPFTMLILEAKGQAQASCISAPSRSFTTLSAMPVSGRPVAPPAGQAQLSSFGGERTPSGQMYGQAEGRVGPGVTGVTVVLDGGTHVTATVANGWFLAWWPGADQTAAVEVTTASGTSTRSVYNSLRTRLTTRASH